MSDSLKYKLFTSTECISEQTMFDYIDNKLSSKERHAVEKHLLDCDLCSDALEGLELVKDRKRIGIINEKISELIAPVATKKNKVIVFNYRIIASIAAAVLLLVGGVFFFDHFTSKEMKDDVAEVKTPTPITSSQQAPPPPVITDKLSASADSNKVSPAKEMQMETPVLKDKEEKTETKQLNREQSDDLKKKLTGGEDYKKRTVSGETTVSKVTTGDADAPKPVNDQSAVVSQESNTTVSQNLETLHEKDAKRDETKKTESVNGAGAASNNYAWSAPSSANQKSDSDAANKQSDKKVITEKGNTYRAEPKKEKAKDYDSKEQVVAGITEEDDKVRKPQTTTTPDNEDVLAAPGLKNANMTADSVYTIVDQMPEFPGGQQELMKYVQKNYMPDSTFSSLYIQFIVNKQGKAINPILLKPTNKETEKNVIDMINKMPLWKPGKLNGKRVSVKYTLPIKF